MGVNLHELEDYIHNIEPVTFAHQIPSFPVSKNNVLQFPQPGSKDAEERKEYIPDYLPPIVSSQEGAKSILCFKLWALCVCMFVLHPQAVGAVLPQSGGSGRTRWVLHKCGVSQQGAVLWQGCFPLFRFPPRVTWC